jgi:hypothetical protein
MLPGRGDVVLLSWESCPAIDGTHISVKDDYLMRYLGRVHAAEAHSVTL